MRVGLTISKYGWAGGDAGIADQLGRIARMADEGGLYSLWVVDHFFKFFGEGAPEGPMLDGYAALSFVAGQTSRVKLGTLVTGVTYRHPGLLGKLVTSLDVLSGGRAYLGIGAAWYEPEHVGLGVPFPPTAERFERLEETLRICRQMFAGDDTPFMGKHYQLDRPLNLPGVLSRPRPPILVGGGGERKTLRLVARYADACNLFERELAHKLGVLRQHCEAVGRPYEEIEKTVYTVAKPLDEPIDQIVDRLAGLAEFGVDHVILTVRDHSAEGTMEGIVEIARKLADVRPT